VIVVMKTEMRIF